MNIRLMLLCLALMSALGFAQKREDVKDVEPTKKTAKGEVFQWTSRSGKPYWYRLPKTSSKKGANLVFMFHGTGMPHPWAFWNYPIAKGSFRGDDIVIAPEGMTPGNGKSFNFVQNKDDEEQIVSLINEFKKKFRINKVYLYGHSQGAFFVYWLAGRQPQLIDGIVAHAGNVLGNVPHTKYAKENLAVAILHGRADAVVSVECATRTHDIYKAEGYKKLKLEIVEGLTAQSGHWPLPSVLPKLFDWLDNVSASSAKAAMSAFAVEAAKKKPSLETLVVLVTKGEELIKKYRGKDKAEVASSVEAARAKLDSYIVAACELYAANAIDPKLKEDQLGYALFRQLHSLLSGQKAWKKGMPSKLIAQAKKDSKKINKTLTKLKKKYDTKSDAAARKTMMGNFSAPEYNELMEFMARKDAEAKKKSAALYKQSQKLNAEATKLIAGIS